jgi:phosphoadenosine phosphosulfate reductase
MGMPKVIVNFSGGKDSTVAILKVLERYPKENVILCYQDTGAEYLETLPFVKGMANLFELPLVILKRDEDFWGLAQRLRHFPTRRMRNCTLYLKIRELNKWIRANRENLGNEIIIASGIRGEESFHRSKLPEWSLNGTTLKDGSFVAKNWNPCLYLKEKEVYDIIEAEGLPLHPCYEFDRRCNCWCCIFQRNHVARLYAEMHPDLYEKACLSEDEIKHKWKNGFGFNDLMASSL